MKKIIVIGSGGAGKSTFSRRLGDALGIPVIHLDQLYWRPNWDKMPKPDWEATVAELVKGHSWIMDGNFGGTREMRMRAADTIIFLDVPRRICLYRAIKRALKYRGTNRPDMAEGCNEKLDLEFIGWVWNYPGRARKRIIDEMKEFPDKRFVTLRSSSEIDLFFERIKNQSYGMDQR
ncbi:MAG TPA: DNA topology modulation protein [Pyrinomonadaceae bacterium]|nr:DNA topology modulation protein [Acidobacteriota bacterium]HQZ97180.1 DNA topology modulation protein [Pyrinomonadaceae bacterium]